MRGRREKLDRMLDLSSQPDIDVQTALALQSLLLAIRSYRTQLPGFFGARELPSVWVDDLEGDARRAALEANQAIYGEVLSAPELKREMGLPSSSAWPVIEFEQHLEEGHILNRLFRLERDFAFVGQVLLSPEGEAEYIEPNLWVSNDFINSNIRAAIVGGGRPGRPDPRHK